MADRNSKAALNVPGKYYVDNTCIDCDLCRQIAPATITRDEESGNSYLFRQPEASGEIEAMEEAVSNCPTESIGRDGLDTIAAESDLHKQPASP